MDKKQRQRAILKIISAQEVETQEQLGELLEQAGFPTTQATISRDMRELKIRKGMSGGGANCYYSPECENPPEYSSVFAHAGAVAGLRHEHGGDKVPPGAGERGVRRARRAGPRIRCGYHRRGRHNICSHQNGEPCCAADGAAQKDDDQIGE